MWILPTSLSTLVEEDSISDSDERCQQLSASLSWNTKQVQPKSWLRTLKRVDWMKHLSGLMVSPSDLRGRTGSLEDHRVSHSASPVNNEAQKIRETSGLSLSAWWSKFSQSVAFSRTSLQSSLWNTSTTSSSQDYNSWVTKLRLDYSQREKLELPTRGNECSSWATPTARDWKDGSNPSTKVPTNALLGRQAPRETGQRLSQNSTQRLRLNPKFVEWLMGFEEDWTQLND